MFVYFVYSLCIYKSTHSIYFENAYIYIHNLLYLIYKHKIFFLNVYVHVFVLIYIYIYIYNKYTQYAYIM